MPPEASMRWPVIQLLSDCSSTDRRVNLVHKGCDCALRIGTLSDSGFVAQPLINQGLLVECHCAVRTDMMAPHPDARRESF